MAGILRITLLFPIMLVMILLVYLNLQINYHPRITINGTDTVRYELLKQLKGLKHALNDSADLRMQHIYPEGYIFMNATYALAWTSFLQHEAHNAYLDEGRAEIQKAWEKINSQTGRAQFSPDLLLPYGAFYQGWSSYVLGNKLRLEGEQERRESEVILFKQQCSQIAIAVQQTTYPESYTHAAWPADAMVALASLTLHDALFTPLYAEVVRDWLSNVRKKLDHRGMIPHAVHPETGDAVENARGSSMSLMLIFLSEIDRQFAEEQFLLFREHFVDNKFGLTGMREYPKGDPGSGDIDSGPVIMGFGGAATIVGIRTLSLFHEDELCLKVRNAVEALSFPIQREDYKKYFFGVLPVVDAFLSWSDSGIRRPVGEVSLVAFRIWCFLVFMIFAVLFWTLARRRSG